jgi:hypothetical protein
LIEINVHVPDERVEEFYIRFGDFLSRKPVSVATEHEPITVDGWTVPAWAGQDNAGELMRQLWAKISDPARDTLLVLATGALDDAPRRFTPKEIAELTQHPKGVSGIAGVLGQVGHVINKVGLPKYAASNGPWHYLWDWDRHAYSMSPTVARLVLAQGS